MPIQNQSPPIVSGRTLIGSTLSTTNGIWAGSPAPLFTYQWYWTETNTPIFGATSSTYVVKKSDLGHELFVIVTAYNGVGPAISAASTDTPPVVYATISAFFSTSIRPFLQAAQAATLVKATASQTIQPFTGFITATGVAAAASGTLSDLISPFTLAATASALDRAALTSTMQPLTQSATGVVVVTGRLNASIQPFTQQASTPITPNSPQNVVAPRLLGTPIVGGVVNASTPSTPTVIDPANLSASAVQSFADEFSSLSLWDGSSGTWETAIYWSSNPAGFTQYGNNEQGWYVDATYAPLSAVRPWNVNNGVLQMVADTANSSVQAITGYPYTAPFMTTRKSFNQQYGYFEAKIKAPAGTGLWPGFWMMTSAGVWPPEFDIFEHTGTNYLQYIATAHTNATGSHTQQTTVVSTPDITAGYHTYGMLWDSNGITWYFDGNAVGTSTNQSDFSQPFYLILQLGVGGPSSFGGAPDSNTVFPATMLVDYVRGYTPAPQTQWTNNPTLTYQFKVNGNPVSGVSFSPSYTVQANDAGGVLTCTVFGTNSSGSNSVTTAPIQIPSFVTTGPTVNGVSATVDLDFTTDTYQVNGGTLALSQVVGSLNGTTVARDTSGLIFTGAEKMGLIGVANNVATGNGIVVVEMDATSDTQWTLVEKGTDTFGNSIKLSQDTLGPYVRLQKTTATNTTPLSFSASQPYRVAFHTDVNSNFRAAVNGGSVFAPGTDITLPATYVSLGCGQSTNSYNLVGRIRRFFFIPVNPTDSQLQTISGLGAQTEPVVTSAPRLFRGDRNVGDTIQVVPGTFTSDTTITTTYQWFQADVGSPISGATSATYVVQSTDQNHFLQCRVRATNTAGSTDVFTEWSGSIGAGTGGTTTNPPVNTAAPAVTGNPVTGNTLTASTGTWTNSPTYAYQWYWSDTSVAISGATSSSYVVVSADVGHTISVKITATNAGGSVSAFSPATAAVAPAPSGTLQPPVLVTPGSISSGGAAGSTVSGSVGVWTEAAPSGTPVNTAPPVVTGTAQVGQTLSSSTGTWTSSTTITYTYQWNKTGAAIAGATSSTYVPVTGDAGSTLTCTVTATNTVGPASQTSAATSTIAPANSTPTNSVVPAISGTAQVGQTLSATTGTWSGYPSPTFSYQWKSGATNVGTNQNTYVPVVGDIGNTITVVVTATNVAGSNTATSSATSAVIAAAAGGSWVPSNISGTAWFDFTDASTQTISSSNITAITSKGSYTLSATAASGQEPTAVSSSNINSGRAGRSDGTKMMVASSSVKWHTIFAVYYSTATGSGNIMAIGNVNGGALNTLQANRGNTNTGFIGLSADFSVQNAMLGPLFSNAVACIGGRYNGTTTTMDFRTDGTSQGTASWVPDSNYQTPDKVILFAGQYNYGLDVGWAGDAAAMIFCDTPITDSDFQKLEGWAAWTYTGSGALLPVGHPYKSAAP